MGGGGFLSDPADAALECYILGLAEKAEPAMVVADTPTGGPLVDHVQPEATVSPRGASADRAVTAVVDL